MNINNLYSSLTTTSTSNVGAITGATDSSSGVSPTGVDEGATASISTPGQFFSELQQLSQQDPAQFKAVASQLATTFQNAASQASGPASQFLSQLASQFSQAAQTGQLAAPPGAQGVQGASAPSSSSQGGAVHHHHHHGGGGGGSGGAIEQAFSSALDIVQQALDGTSSSTSTSSSGSSTT